MVCHCGLFDEFEKQSSLEQALAHSTLPTNCKRKEHTKSPIEINSPVIIKWSVIAEPFRHLRIHFDAIFLIFFFTLKLLLQPSFEHIRWGARTKATNKKKKRRKNAAAINFWTLGVNVRSVSMNWHKKRCLEVKCRQAKNKLQTSRETAMEKREWEIK